MTETMVVQALQVRLRDSEHLLLQQGLLIFHLVVQILLRCLRLQFLKVQQVHPVLRAAQVHPVLQATQAQQVQQQVLVLQPLVPDL